MSIQLATVQHICVRKLPKQDDFLSSSSFFLSLTLCICLSLSLSCKGFINIIVLLAILIFLFICFIIFLFLNFWGLICSSFCFFLRLMLRSWVFSVFFHCMCLGHSFVCTLWVWIWPDLTSFICQICSIIQLKIFLIAVVISPLFRFLWNSVSIATFMFLRVNFHTIFLINFTVIKKYSLYIFNPSNFIEHNSMA